MGTGQGQCRPGRGSAVRAVVRAHIRATFRARDRSPGDFLTERHTIAAVGRWTMKPVVRVETRKIYGFSNVRCNGVVVHDGRQCTVVTATGGGESAQNIGMPQWLQNLHWGGFSPLQAAQRSETRVAP